MKASEFRALLQLAISGERTAVEALISLYMPLINRYSVIDGKLMMTVGSTSCCIS